MGGLRIASLYAEDTDRRILGETIGDDKAADATADDDVVVGIE